MNGKEKFHPNGPAFAPGEQWGNLVPNITIVRTEVFGPGKFDFTVFFKYSDGVEGKKDAYGFQIHYTHIADRNIKSKSL
jgi:hypothetical protein